MKPRFEYTTFTASEAERISSVNGENQRNLRRHGYLAPIAGGKAKFGLEDIARLVVIGFLSERGFPPAISTTIANFCAAMVAAHALDLEDAVGDKDARKALIEKLAPDGLHRFAVVTGPSPNKMQFGNNAKKIVYAASELGGAIMLDLRFYGSRIVDGAKRPLVTFLAKERDVA
jgi:hypothetical protein